ncbi:hydrolase, partial [Vibrio natriegens]
PTLMESMLSAATPASTYSSGVNLFTSSSKRRWILAGNEDDIVMIQPQTTTVVDKYGNYRFYNEDYIRMESAKPKLSTLMQAM